MISPDTAEERRTILVLGANAGQADLIRHMRAIGWTAVSCAHKSGLPGAAISDRFELVDVMDVDAVAGLAREINADLVYSISSDVAMITAVRVSEMLDLPHFYSSALIQLFNQKDLLRKHLNEHGLSRVEFAQITKVNQLSDWNEFPCVVKPADAQGQRGVQIVRKMQELQDAANQALSLSQQGSALVEQYLSGVEISANALVCGGRLVINEVSERLVHRGALFGIPKGHLVPCYNVPGETQKAAMQLVADVVASLNITDGCLYFQMKVTPEGPKIIEIAPRLDGCHMWRLIKHATSVDFLAATIDCLLGQEFAVTRRLDPGVSVHELMFQQTPPGALFSAEQFPRPGDALYHEYRYQEGQEIAPINGLMEVVGYYVRPVSAAEAVKYERETLR